MIINIRGTSGTGKSTLARQLMALYQPNPLRYREEGRKQPLGYRYKRKGSGVCNNTEAFLSGENNGCDGTGCTLHGPAGHDLAVVGHYETDCGGADTIPDYEKLMKLVVQGAAAGMDVLFEGLLFSGDVKHTIALHDKVIALGDRLHVVAIQMPLDVCVASVNQRRREKVERQAAARLEQPIYKPDVNPKNTIAKHRGLTLACQRLEASGVTVHRPEGREAAFQLCKELLRLP